MPTLGQLVARQAHRAPTRDALVHDGRRITWAELDSDVNRATAVLQRGGMVQGERLGVMSTNCDDLVVALYAAAKLGLLVVPINPRMAAPEVTWLLEDSGATGFVFHPRLAATADKARAAASTPPRFHLPLGPTPDRPQDLRSLMAEAPDHEPGTAVSESDDAEILYTSGTTGRPKGVLLDHHRAIWAGLNVTTTVGMADGERILQVAPLYHSAGLNLFLHGGTAVGATHVLLEAFDPDVVLDVMESERITTFFGVPTMYQMLLDRPDFAGRDLSAWRLGMFGAAPMPPVTIERLRKAAPQVQLFNLCGPTEAGPGGVGLGPEHIADRPSANGWPILNTEARVVDSEGNDVAPGSTGEVVLRGESVMKGYWNNPEATAEALRNGWLHTGDVARIDDDGCITLVDRMKDMIITGGMNVYSVEVENAVAAHPSVADCAIVGVPHPVYGESVVAVVTPREGCSITIEDLRSHVSTLIADYKAPHRLVLGEVPRNASGKILKHVLRERIGGEQGALS
ncbi:class I adenylate-forming enzyme family protein [Nocardioides panzhihuensis]|uniref:Fatty-acyl-CoA synthase/feruloyl-CoA synthase n=1 Tax=Nocardioides panzhihuensis TaxID=860243 RepID=A0A7Z0DHS5_9ACTN|nr:AMP-binding protein [Nocardioides panzhihuensis]NYI75835.1 fatty-acyl-CoA synthase/feruloyl-CoA synthase [Nocardioides panzhihuensis]